MCWVEDAIFGVVFCDCGSCGFSGGDLLPWGCLFRDQIFGVLVVVGSSEFGRSVGRKRSLELAPSCMLLLGDFAVFGEILEVGGARLGINVGAWG